MRAILTILVIAVLAIGLSYAVSSMRGSGRLSPAPQEEAAEKAVRDAQNANLPKVDNSETFTPNRQGVITADMVIKGQGSMVIELYPADAPKAVAAMTKLIDAGYYNGLQIKGYVPGQFFMTGGAKNRMSEYKPPATEAQLAQIRIPHEKNSLKNVTGSLALAIDTKKTKLGSPRFLVNLKPNHDLDPIYPVFGKVVQGIEVAKEMQAGDIIDRFAIRK